MEQLSAISTIELAALVGQRVGTSPWVLIDQGRIDRFAEVTEDHQFIHVDPERAAREAPFGGTVAHGYLTLSLLGGLFTQAVPPLEGASMMVNYGLNAVRFLAPVRAGRRVRVHYGLKQASQRQPGQWLLVFTASMEIEGEERPALAAENVLLVTVPPGPGESAEG